MDTTGAMRALDTTWEIAMRFELTAGLWITALGWFTLLYIMVAGRDRLLNIGFMTPSIFSTVGPAIVIGSFFIPRDIQARIIPILEQYKIFTWVYTALTIITLILLGSYVVLKILEVKRNGHTGAGEDSTGAGHSESGITQA